MNTFQADVDAVNQIPVINSILEMICLTTGMGFAAVARVTEDKWIACAVRDDIQFGLKPGGELQIKTTICNEIRQSGTEVVIDHVALDEAFAHHHTPAMYGFQSYISVPIVLKSGKFFGTLCAIDPRPARLKTPEVISMFKLNADLISFHLQAIDQLAQSEIKLLEERRAAEVREQFIAILGHDLRNPITAVSNSAQLLKRMAPDERVLRLANIIQDSTFRMTGLIDNILDFARGRLGGGIVPDCETTYKLEETLTQVITEMQAIWPDRVIETDINLATAVNCDRKRIAQLFSNILGNALTHGKKNTPVKVQVLSNENEFRLAVTNQGEKIPEAMMERLFQPFYRGDVEPNKEGLGLGLYIASDIARAHGGTLSAVSDNNETRFTLIIPVSCEL